MEKAVIAALSQMLEAVIAEDRRIRKAVSKSQGTASNIRLSLGQLEIKIQKTSRSKLDCYEAYAEGNLSREAYIADTNPQ